MAKKSKSSKHHMPTLHKHVPHWVSYTLLIALFILVLKMVKKMVGMGY